MRALRQRGFTVDMSRYGTPDGQADAEGLLRPDVIDYAAIKKAHTEEFLPILSGAEGGKPEKIGDNDVAAAGQVLKALIDAYEALKKSLYTESGGQLAASTIEREALMSTDRATSPALFVTGQDAA